MSTGKTNNIQLNQWEPQDSFLREEFNEDNRKIDAAIAGLRADLHDVILLDVITQRDAVQVDLDLSAIDFTQFWKVELFLECEVTDTLYIRTNGVCEKYYMMEQGKSSTMSLPYLNYFYQPDARAYCSAFTQPAAGIFVAMSITNFYYAGNAGGTDQLLGVSPVTWDALTSFNFYCATGNVPAGTRIALRGVKR